MMTEKHERLAYEARQAMQNEVLKPVKWDNFAVVWDKYGDPMPTNPRLWPQHREAKIASHLPAGLLGWLW